MYYMNNQENEQAYERNNRFIKEISFVGLHWTLYKMIQKIMLKDPVTNNTTKLNRFPEKYEILTQWSLVVLVMKIVIDYNSNWK